MARAQKERSQFTHMARAHRERSQFTHMERVQRERSQFILMDQRERVITQRRLMTKRENPIRAASMEKRVRTTHAMMATLAKDTTNMSFNSTQQREVKRLIQRDIEIYLFAYHGEVIS